MSGYLPRLMKKTKRARNKAVTLSHQMKKSKNKWISAMWNHHLSMKFTEVLVIEAWILKRKDNLLKSLTLV